VGRYPLLFILLPLLVTAVLCAAGFTRCLPVLAILLARDYSAKKKTDSDVSETEAKKNFIHAHFYEIDKEIFDVFNSMLWLSVPFDDTPMNMMIIAPNVLEPSVVRQTLGLLQVQGLH
jgi:hypothetical protein